MELDLIKKQWHVLNIHGFHATRDGSGPERGRGV